MTFNFVIVRPVGASWHGAAWGCAAEQPRVGLDDQWGRLKSPPFCTLFLRPGRAPQGL